MSEPIRLERNRPIGMDARDFRRFGDLASTAACDVASLSREEVRELMDYAHRLNGEEGMVVIERALAYICAGLLEQLGPGRRLR